MNFRPRRQEDPEINIIPFIDVLLVILIFLMLSTTYAKFTEFQIKLPTADVDQQGDYPKEMIVKVTSDGNYFVNENIVEGKPSVSRLSELLLAASQGSPETVVIISADALSPHQAVISMMEAAKRAGLSQVRFAAKPSGG